MTWTEWLSLAAVCSMGAMSPGPSLALVVQHTLRGGRGNGVMVALTHGLGIGIYAFLTVLGLAVVITQSPTLFNGLRYGGAVFLAYLGVKSLISRSAAARSMEDDAPPDTLKAWVSARDGFLVAFLNPKIAVFFLALFSQFVRPGAGVGEKLGMAGLAAGIDAVWYALVALALSHSRVLPALRRHAGMLDRLFGVILLALAVRVLTL